MPLNFEKYAMKGNEFINHLVSALESTDRAHAARILRSTFRVLRNHITFEESLQLLSQLPMAIKAVYVDGWKKGDHYKIKTVDDLVAEIIREDGQTAWRDFSSKEEILNGVRAVISTMRVYVSPEEIDQALHTLPGKVHEVLSAEEQ